MTNHHKNIWNRYLGYKTGNKLTDTSLENKLSHEELCDLIKVQNYIVEFQVSI